MSNPRPPVHAPWPPVIVAMLKQRQEMTMMHPYTCPGDKPECEGKRNLIPTKDGWVCQCGEYKQDWY